MPNDFQIGPDRFVFVDFTEVVHHLVFRTDRRVSVESTVTFDAASSGRPIFDLALDGCLDHQGQAAPPRISLGGGVPKPLEAVQPPQSDVWYSAATDVITPRTGLTATLSYQLDVEDLQSGSEDDPLAVPTPTADHFDCYLELCDGTGPTDGRRGRPRRFHGRCFLSRYLVASPEDDPHKIVFDIALETPHAHTVYVSGRAPVETTAQSGMQHARVSLDPRYTASCPFLFVAPHTYPRSTELTFARPGEADGTIRAFSKLGQQVAQDAANLARNLLVNQLQPLLGAFPHPDVTLFVTSYDAMEYAGAFSVTMNCDENGYADTSDTLFHELVHGYLGRCVLPASGNAGWFDEAFAVWLSRGAPAKETPPDAFVDAAARDPYRADTAEASYTVGAMLLAHMAHLRGGSEAFLKDLKQRFDALRWIPLSAAEIEAQLVAIDPRFQALLAHVNSGPGSATLPTAAGSSPELRELLSRLLDNESRDVQFAFFRDPETTLTDHGVHRREERAILFTMNRERIASWVANDPRGGALADRVGSHHFKSAWPPMGPEPSPAAILRKAAAAAGGWTDPHPHGRGITPAAIPAQTATDVVVHGEGFLQGCTVHVWPEDAPGDRSRVHVVPPDRITLSRNNFRRCALKFALDLPAGRYVVSVSNDPATLVFAEEIRAGQILEVG